MKNFINIVLTGFLIAAFSSCVPQETDVFGESSATRIEKAILESETILTDAPNGWHIEYYPASERQYGGYNLLVSFSKDGNTTVSSDRFAPDVKTTSTYSIKQSAGVILSFDTFNDVMHYFSDPKNSDGIGKDGKGMEGDLEFKLMEVTKEKVVLQGRKTGNMMTMTPLSPDVKWEDYLKSVRVSDVKYSDFVRLNYVQGDFRAKVSLSHRCFTFTYGDNISVTAPFIITKEATLKFYEPLELNGVTIEGLKYNNVGEFGELVPLNSVEATLTPYALPFNEYLYEKNWFFGLSTMGEFGKPFWEDVYKNIIPKIGAPLSYVYFKKDAGMDILFSWYCGGSGSLVYTGVFSGKTQITFKFAGSAYGNGVDFWTKYSWSRMVVPFHERTFEVGVDNKLNPKVLTLTEVGNAKNVIKVFAQVIYDPFNE